MQILGITFALYELRMLSLVVKSNTTLTEVSKNIFFLLPLQTTREVFWPNATTQVTSSKGTFVRKWTAHVGLHGAECGHGADQGTDRSGLF